MQSRRYGHHFWQAQQGFTIVELLIVIVVIAILAAITIIAYNGITQRANASATQDAINTAVNKVTLYGVDNSDAVPADLATAGITTTNGITYQYSVNTTTNPQGFCVTATLNGVAYYAGRNYSYTGASSGTVNNTTPTSGTCPGHASTGVAIHNYATNPNIETNNNSYGQPNSSVVVRDNTRAHSGTYSMKTTMPADIAGNVGMSLYINPIGGANALQPNTDYTISAYVYAPAGVVDPYLTIQGTARASKGDPAGYKTTLRNQWVRLYNTFTTNSSGTIALYLLNNGTTTAGMQYWIDDVMISEGSTPPNYADGNSAGWVWTGGTNASASTGPAL